MKKIWLMLLMVCAVCVFSACSDDDDEGPASQNPVTDVSVPATAEIGSEITVTGTGFATNAKLYFKNSVDEKTDVTKADFTASGATLTIPMSLTAGEYRLYLVQNGEWELGKITLTAASLPVIGLEVPAEGWIGKKLTIGGSGFNSTAKMYLENAEGERTELTTPDITSGFVAKIPATVQADSYKLILVQDGGEWILEGAFKVVEAPVIKRLVGVRNVSSMTITDYSGLSELSPEELEGIGASSVEELQGLMEQMLEMYSGESEMTVAYENNLLKEVKRDGQTLFTFVCTDNQIKGENQNYDPDYDATISFVLNLEDGRVDNSTAEYTKGSGSGAYNWKYDDNGNWQGLATATSGKDYSTYIFKDGNFVSTWEDEEMFVYDRSDWKNNPYGIDVALYLYSVNTGIEDSEQYAILFGLCGKPSVNLPSASLLREDAMPLTYEWDEDGYVTSVSMSAQGADIILGILPMTSSDRYEFIYEVVDYE